MSKLLKEEKKEAKDRLLRSSLNNDINANVDELSLLLHRTHPIGDNDEDDRLALSLYYSLFRCSSIGPFCFCFYNCSVCGDRFKFFTMIDKIYWKTTARKIPSGLGYRGVCGRCDNNQHHDAGYYVGNKFREGLWNWYNQSKQHKYAQDYLRDHPSCFYGEEEECIKKG